MTVEVKVPALGESVLEVQIVQWLKQPGDWVQLDEDLVEIDSEKATVHVPAPAAGVLTEILKGDGEFANVGDLIAQLDETASPEKAAAKEPEPKEETGQGAQAEPAEAPAESAASEPQGDITVMPAAARLLAEHGLKAEQVRATGPGGRLLKEDVLRHIEAKQPAPAAAPKAPQAAAKPTPKQAAAPQSPAEQESADRQEEIVPMSIIRRHIARRLVEAQQSAALLTTFNEADMSAVIELRKKYRDRFEKKYGIKLGFMSFFAKAAVEALKRFPQVNAELRGTDVVYRNYYDVSVAIGGGKGLVAPVLRNVERMSFAEIELAIEDFAKRAASGDIKPEELEGGTFTISNGGIYGSLLSTPIVNPPQSGILGLHAIQERPVALDGNVVIRPMMYLALTYDHRIVDGREAVTFLRTIKEIIEDPARMILEV